MVVTRTSRVRTDSPEQITRLVIASPALSSLGMVGSRDQWKNDYRTDEYHTRNC